MPTHARTSMDHRTSLSDLQDRAYHSQVRRAVAGAVEGGATTLTELCQRCEGAFPTVVFDVAREVIGSGVEQWPHRRWPEEALGTEDAAVPSMPEPHPIDFEWRFTAETADELATMLSASGGRIACFGTPSVFVRLAHRGADAVLFDRNPGLRRHFASALHARMQTFDLSRPVPSDTIPPTSIANGGLFGTMLLDPPWYVSHTLAWLAQALVRLRDGGRVILTLFPELVRPAADVEREQVLAVLRSLGDVHRLSTVLRYTTPVFESETLSAFGLADLGQWRAGELFEVTVRDPRAHAIDAPVIEERGWERIQLGRQVIAIRHDPTTRHLPFSISPTGAAGSFLLRSVSARDPIRQRVTLWTSRNRGALVSGTDTAVRFLTLLAAGQAPSDLINGDSVFTEARAPLMTLLALVGW